MKIDAYACERAGSLLASKGADAVTVCKIAKGKSPWRYKHVSLATPHFFEAYPRTQFPSMPAASNPFRKFFGTGKDSRTSHAKAKPIASYIMAIKIKGPSAATLCIENA